MKKLAQITLLLLFTLSFGTSAFAARQNETLLRGSLVDTAGEPAGFATAYLSDVNGALVCGDTADEGGHFELRAAQGDYTLTISLVGYRDFKQVVKLAGALVDLPTITLEEDSEVLGEAVVQAVMPKTKLTGEGLATSVRGSVLENAGTARDVLGKVPGMIKGRDGLEVVGKGAPRVYINGRRMTDASELDRLQSHEIQSVEVINNPGAQYDASVRAVVRIRTIRRQGEGFGFNVALSDEQSLRYKDNNDPNANLNVNYRTGGVDIFAGANYTQGTQVQVSDLMQETGGKANYRQDERLEGLFVQKNVGFNGGLNWQIADNHFAGFKADYNFTPSNMEDIWMEGDIFENGALLDHLRTESTAEIGNKMPHIFSGNAYYNGSVGKLGIDLNLDYYTVTDNKLSKSLETSIIEGATVNTESSSELKLYAGKLVLSYPIWRGMLQFGTEETFTRGSDDYTLQGAAIPASSSRVSEDNIAAFANYAFTLGQFGQVNAGLRYEHVNYAYEDLLGDGSFTRKYDNFFPSISFAGAFGQVQQMLSYSVRTTRPNFTMLSDAIRYNNRYTLQSGNTALQPQIFHSFSSTTLWKFLALVVNYGRRDDPILTWAEPFNDEGVILLKPRNLEQPYRQLAAYLSATPTIGPWTLNFVTGIQQGWLTVDIKDNAGKVIRSRSYNDKPLFFVQCNNTFNLPKGWQIELGAEYHSPGYSENVMVTNHYLNVEAAIQKTLLRDGSLVLRITGSDLAGLGHNDIDGYLDTYHIIQSLRFDTQRVGISLRYRFNSAASKYKGTGAGADAKSRMK
ncbi:MAG: outer membrane beta-barrel protein [Bacteroidales bacterium]|nr:outer membrane beta-barrel protein [Bacteroidales bacterium]